MSNFLHVILDSYEYQDLLLVTKKDFFKENFVFLNLHMELGAIAGYKDIAIKPRVKFKQQLCSCLEIHCAILSFIANYDGLFLNDGRVWYDQEKEKIQRILDVAKNGEQQLVLWHRNSAESLSALFYMVSILKPIVNRGAIREGVNLNREIKRLIYSQSLIDGMEEQRIVEKCSKPILQGKDHWIDCEYSRLIFENSDMRIIHSPYQSPISAAFNYFDNFLLSYFKGRPVKPETLIKAIQNDVGGKQYFWISFLIFRLCELRDNGYFDIISTPTVLDITKPTIFGERWKVQKQKETPSVEFDYDELRNLLCSESADFEAEQHLDYLLHTIPLNEKTSKAFLMEAMEAEQVTEKNKIIVCLLVRFAEFLTPTERITLLKNYQYSELTTEGDLCL